MTRASRCCPHPLQQQADRLQTAFSRASSVPTGVRRPTWRSCWRNSRRPTRWWVWVSWSDQPMDPYEEGFDRSLRRATATSWTHRLSTRMIELGNPSPTRPL